MMSQEQEPPQIVRLQSVGSNPALCSEKDFNLTISDNFLSSLQKPPRLQTHVYLTHKEVRDTDLSLCEDSLLSSQLLITPLPAQETANPNEDDQSTVLFGSQTSILMIQPSTLVTVRRLRRRQTPDKTPSIFNQMPCPKGCGAKSLRSDGLTLFQLVKKQLRLDNKTKERMSQTTDFKEATAQSENLD